MGSQQRVIVVQLQSTDRVDSNVQQILSLLSTVKRSEIPTLVCFPENSLYFRIQEGQAIPGIDLEDPCFEALASRARELNATFHLGSVPLRWQGKLVNSSVRIEADGRVSAGYQKIHLFDIQLEGQKPIRESDVFHHGPEPRILDCDGWRWGQTICYDLRFSELYSHYARQSVDGLLVPAAFLKKTGEAHWHVLLRARAIESQCYVVAAAQAGTHRSAAGQRETYGHSLVVDPWGQILAEGSADQPEVLEVTLSRDRLDQVRKQIPMSQHRRLL